MLSTLPLGLGAVQVQQSQEQNEKVKLQVNLELLHPLPSTLSRAAKEARKNTTALPLYTSNEKPFSVQTRKDKRELFI